MKLIFEQAHILLHDLYPEKEIDSLVKLLLQRVCNQSRTNILMYKSREILLENRSEVMQMLSRLQTGEPIQYILGETEFYGLHFKVSPAVLIPRPETEELVDKIIKENSTSTGLSILDVGTGSGCIAISLSKHLPHANVEAWDISEKALSMAIENNSLNKTNVEFHLVDVLTFIPNEFSKKYDIIVSNPPYICEEEASAMHINVMNNEPHLALFVPDEDPFLFYRTISRLGLCLLNTGGKIYFEINERFGNQTIEMMKGIGYSNVVVIKDIFGKDRIVYAQL